MRRLMIVCLLCLMLAAPLYAQDNTLTPYQIALQRIKAARESNATELDLSGLGLTELSPEIGRLNHLLELDLGNNQLTSLPPEIGQLSNLRILHVSRNRLTLLPSEIGQLGQLQWLSFNQNQLANLPSEIGQLSNLRWFFLYDNELVALPHEIGQLSQLCLFDLRYNDLRHLPKSIANLNSLIDFCPSSFGLRLDGNPLTSPPPQVVERGTSDVLAYLYNPWYHMQRLIVGAAGGVGLFALLLLGFRWKQRGGRKPKQKRG